MTSVVQTYEVDGYLSDHNPGRIMVPCVCGKWASMRMFNGVDYRIGHTYHMVHRRPVNIPYTDCPRHLSVTIRPEPWRPEWRLQVNETSCLLSPLYATWVMRRRISSMV